MKKSGKSILMLAIILMGISFARGEARLKLQDSWEIGRVPAGFPVNFCLLTHADRQYVAYYNEKRQMTVASRLLGSDIWDYKTLPTKIGWDSHNYITMAVDKDGHLHVSGNMHNVPLIYFLTEKAGDISTLTARNMTGEQEDSTTYPRFMKDNKGNLIFNYRNGGSGKGDTFYNIYNTKTRSWSHLIDQPLLDGQEKMNAYASRPMRGPDGYFHMVWVWRDTPDSATNHHLSHVRSKDLIHWESAMGEQVELPITIDNKSLWVDPIPSGGGIINGCQKLFFDAENRPVISYHKSDANGHMQIYAKRFDGQQWNLHTLTDWKKEVAFGGMGSLGFMGIKISGLERIEPDLLTISYRHRDYGTGRLFIDEDSLKPIEKNIDLPDEYPKQLEQVESSFEGMGIRRVLDIGEPADPLIHYVLQWETLDRNRDRRRKPPLPEPSQLMLYKLTTNVQKMTP